ncbi:interleukin-2 receptor subunit alpha isoform X1 [Vulpes lagopus]|uniref:interleukin-2 receptor subunit alpha isoform X1 n=1 Tax=Vulpes lagopus TaxID=494514 RepID=UPI001BC9A0D2|nr:interleukin-2 receptor subunit alpha isoform X1 [Vulpes lagopus]
MEPSLLMWGILTFITVSGYTTDFCDDPPNLKHATFKALTYKTGTVLNCDCERGFRRISSYMRCTGNSSHASWENKCQCKSISPENRKGKVTTKPEEQKGENPTEMQSQTPPMDEVDLVGHCREPPPWEHENSKRIYHFVVGQTLHYQCMQGFTALHRGPAKSVCKTIFGKTRWTQPPLKCIGESQFPDDEELQASTDAPAGRDTSSPFITTSTPGKATISGPETIMQGTKQFASWSPARSCIRDGQAQTTSRPSHVSNAGSLGGSVSWATDSWFRLRS